MLHRARCCSNFINNVRIQVYKTSVSAIKKQANRSFRVTMLKNPTTLFLIYLNQIKMKMLHMIMSSIAQNEDTTPKQFILNK